VRQHDVYRVRCACGREHVAALPDGVSAAPCGYGMSLCSLVVYLLVYQHLPVGRCVELIGDLTGGAQTVSDHLSLLLSGGSRIRCDSRTQVSTVTPTLGDYRGSSTMGQVLQCKSRTR